MPPVSQYAPTIPQPPKKKGGSRNALAIAGISALAFIGVVVLVCLVSVFVLGLAQNNRTAKMLPAQGTRALVSLNPTLLQLPSLVYFDRLEKGVGVFGAVPGAQDLMSTMQNSIFKDLEIDPMRDILPWVGNEISLAMIDGQEVSRSNHSAHLASLKSSPVLQYSNSSVLLTAATRNRTASDAFFRKLFQKAQAQGAEISVRQYKNVPITEVYDAYGNLQLAVATYQGMLVASPDTWSIDFLINSAGQPKESLYQDNLYQDMLKRLPANRMGSFYIDTTSLLQDSYLAAPLFSATETVAGSFSLRSSGLRFDYLMKMDPSQLSSVEKEMLTNTSSQNRILARMPGKSALYVSGQNLGLLFDYYLMQVSSGDAQLLEESYASMKDQFGIDIKEGILNNMQGEYALSLPPDLSNNNILEMPFNIVFTIQVTDPQTVQRNLQIFLQKLADQSYSQLDIRQVQDSTIYSISDNSSNFSLGLVFNGDFVSFCTSADLLDTMASNPQSALANNAVFRQTISSLPKRERMYAVVDVQTMLNLVLAPMDPSARRDFQDQYEPYLTDLKSLGFSIGKMDNASIIHGQLQVNTK